MTERGFDFLVIGGGIIGLAIAREIKRRNEKAEVGLIEKEEECGLHASGRNSGVLHAGFYYTANSLKAKFCKEGNQDLCHYCEEKNIQVNRCGKLVVAANEKEIEGLQELLRRAKTNEVDLLWLTEKEAKEIEPRVKTTSYALYSPTTASVNPLAVLKALQEDAKKEGISIFSKTAYIGRSSDGILSSKGPIQAQFIINAAGLYADQIALDFGCSERYRILPFKGLYLYSEEKAFSLKTHIYPVPDLKYPFLGVHFTLTHSGHIKIGPTAIPALWREQYEGFSNFKKEELFEIASRQIRLLFSSNWDFKRLAFEEMQKYFGKKIISLASKLVDGVFPQNYHRWGRPGIRAQLFDVKTQKLENDFVIEKGANSLHILNAVSPGFTASLPFARHVVDLIA